MPPSHVCLEARGARKEGVDGVHAQPRCKQHEQDLSRKQTHPRSGKVKRLAVPKNQSACAKLPLERPDVGPTCAEMFDGHTLAVSTWELSEDSTNQGWSGLHGVPEL